MKISVLLLLLFVFQYGLLAQTTLGHVITSDGETIEIFKRNDKKTKLTKMQNGCDCERKAGVSFLFVNKEGKVKSLRQSKIDKVLIKKGARYCEEFTSAGSVSSGSSLGIKLEQDFEMLCLPYRKGGGARVLQTVLISNDKYILAMYQGKFMDQNLNFYSKSNKQLLEGKYEYGDVGYSKSGKKALSTIKKYFKDCPNILNEIDKTLEFNKTVKKFEMIPVLQNVAGMTCGSK